MKAQLLTAPRSPLTLADIPKPSPKEGEILLAVEACGVCRTDLHIFEGDLPLVSRPLILGHQIVGIVEETGKGVSHWKKGDRAGAFWLASTCGTCSYCIKGMENLCPQAQFTGYHTQGGFAEYAVCKADYAIELPASPPATHLAPLLCAGLIGFRAYRKAAPEKTIGLYGFGSSAHIITQVAKQEGKEVYAFTRPGDRKKQAFAKKLGAVQAGAPGEVFPKEGLDAAVVFASDGNLVPLALQALKGGGRCICAGIHMSDIPSFPYERLFLEKVLSSVSHLTRKDAKEFFSLLSGFSVHTEVEVYPLEEADKALRRIKEGNIEGSVVLQIRR